LLRRGGCQPWCKSRRHGVFRPGTTKEYFRLAVAVGRCNVEPGYARGIGTIERSHASPGTDARIRAMRSRSRTLRRCSRAARKRLGAYWITWAAEWDRRGTCALGDGRVLAQVQRLAR